MTKSQNKCIYVTRKYYLRWNPVSFHCEGMNLDAVNRERRQVMQLNRESTGSNSDILLLLFQFLIWIFHRSIRNYVTSQNPVYVILIADWSPRYWNHGRSCFIGGKDIFWWPSGSCK